MPPAESPTPPLRAPIPSGVWALGFVSLFMDVSSEMIHALLPVFLVSVLGASVATVGLLEGMAEAIASITKVFSGTLSDRLGKRKALAIAGYGLAALTKPFFALAPTTPGRHERENNAADRPVIAGFRSIPIIYFCQQSSP